MGHLRDPRLGAGSEPWYAAALAETRQFADELLSAVKSDLFKSRHVKFRVEPAKIELAPGKMRAIVEAAGLRLGANLSFLDLADSNFDGKDIRDFLFTGSNLTGASFDGARIEGAIFDSARVSLGALAKAADFPAYLKWELDRPAATRYPLDPSRLPNLAAFRETPFAPEMVVIPAGEFLMGSDRGSWRCPRTTGPGKTKSVPAAASGRCGSRGGSR